MLGPAVGTILTEPIVRSHSYLIWNGIFLPEILFREIREEVLNIPGAEIKVTKLEDGPPQGNDISYDVVGQDYRLLGEIAGEIEKIILKYRSKFDQIDTDYEAAKPEIKVLIDREKANRLGFNTRVIASTIRTAISGSKESTIRRGKDEYDVMLRLTKDARDQLSYLRTIWRSLKMASVFLCLPLLRSSV